MTSENNSNEGSRFSASAFSETLEVSRLDSVLSMAPNISSSELISKEDFVEVPSSSIFMAREAVPGEAN